MVTYSSTYTAMELVERWQGLSQFRLDVAGAAQAFAWTFGHGDWTYPFNHARAHDPISFDSESGVWREFIAGNGWTVKDSILPEMSDITSALCALEAYTIVVRGVKDETKIDPDPEIAREAREAHNAKVDKEYCKLRQRHLGGNVDKAVKVAEALLSVPKWNVDDNRIGLPDAESLHVTPLNPEQAVRREPEVAEHYITRHLADAPGLISPIWASFVLDLADGDQEMADALQIWTAAALLKGNPEHKTHILYGDGATGKSTFLKADKPSHS